MNKLFIFALLCVIFALSTASGSSSHVKHAPKTESHNLTVHPRHKEREEPHHSDNNTPKDNSSGLDFFSLLRMVVQKVKSHDDSLLQAQQQDYEDDYYQTQRNEMDSKIWTSV